MKILKNTITILSETIILILAILWYKKTLEYEPLIAIIVSSIALISSFGTRLFSRPKIELHHIKTDWGRLTKGYTANNPPIIRVGIDNPEQYWELFWNYILEVRNNSSLDAYSIEMDYKNIPEKTFIHGKIGKIEPIKANDKRELKVKVVQNITGTHLEADKYLKDKIDELMKSAIVNVKYKDESRTSYYTKYYWLADKNKFSIFK